MSDMINEGQESMDPMEYDLGHPNCPMFDIGGTLRTKKKNTTNTQGKRPDIHNI